MVMETGVASFVLLPSEGRRIEDEGCSLSERSIFTAPIPAPFTPALSPPRGEEGSLQSFLNPFSSTKVLVRIWIICRQRALVFTRT
jgi:hypothetical protein